ncbi:MAG: hypothetical protein H5T84_07100, partial [Thermoleophilia bacterium]|nr:hypothetical protein [Thermoleophilia bacterium]
MTCPAPPQAPASLADLPPGLSPFLEAHWPRRSWWVWPGLPALAGLIAVIVGHSAAWRFLGGVLIVAGAAFWVGMAWRRRVLARANMLDFRTGSVISEAFAVLTHEPAPSTAVSHLEMWTGLLPEQFEQ